jgi:hypothetical protein
MSVARLTEGEWLAYSVHSLLKVFGVSYG